MTQAIRLAAELAALCFASLPAICDAADWPTKCRNREYVCTMVSVSSGDVVTVSPDPIGLARNSAYTKLIWVLPEGYVFDRSKGDGIFVKNQNGEFDRETVVDDDESQTSQPRKRFRIRAHWPLQAAGGYQYAVIFHELRGGAPVKRFQCDPTIVNSEGFSQLRPGAVQPQTVSPPLTCVVQ